MRPFNTPTRRGLGSLLFGLAVLPAAAANFGVSPIRIDLDRGARSGAITVSNDDEGGVLRVQMRLFEWTQDAAGKDDYRESDELLYFPRLMTLEKGEQKLVRAGLRVPATTQEKTYRLFIEELPAPPAAGAPAGAQVAIAVRFGVPIFVKPLKEEIRGEIESIKLANGVLRVGVRNSGNVQFTISSITAASGETFSKEVPGWYLLAGAAREYAIDLPEEACTRLERLDITVKTEKLPELRGKLDVNAAMCRH